jgi:hypothetical protein
MLPTTLLRKAGVRWSASRRIVIGLLRELADESAYERHLAQRGRSASPAEWRLFLDERLRGKYGRPKCC